VENKLLAFINERILSEKGVTVGPEDELLLDGYLDSMAIFNLVYFIENSFGLPVPAQDITIENFRSVHVISEYLERRVV
jgi:acyl carrier protein